MSGLSIPEELDGFESCILLDFDAYRYANSLLLATNDEDGTELDVTTPLKRVQFDLRECENRSRLSILGNQESLVSNYFRSKEVIEQLCTQIHPSLALVNTSFKRIKSTVADPYEEASRKNEALKKVHTTFSLLRSSGYFMFLLQQINELEERQEGSNPLRNMVRLAKFYSFLQSLYDEAKAYSKSESSAMSGLYSIRFVRDYEPIYISRKNAFRNSCNKTLADVCEKLFTSEYDQREIQNSLAALYVLEQQEYLRSVETLLFGKAVLICFSHFLAFLQSNTNFEDILSSFVEHCENCIRSIESVLSVDLANLEIKSRTSILSHYLSAQKYQSTHDAFWNMLLAPIKKHIAATMARGGPPALAMRDHYRQLSGAVDKVISNHSLRDTFSEALALVGLEGAY